MALSTRHLPSIKYITREDIELIFETVANFKEVINRPIRRCSPARYHHRQPVFWRTHCTRIFELAEKRLSADTVNFSASSSSVKKGETLLDTVNNILAMKVDMVVMRHPLPGAHVFLSKHIPAQIVNAGDGTHEHPTQALLDCFSLTKIWISGREEYCHCRNITHSRVALSNIFALKLLGANVWVCGPPH